MFYSVNGGAEKTINLFGGSKALPEVTASHTIYLEEMGLKPGDFVSYYAKATDNDAVAGGKTTTSDIYFVQIRPFRKDYKPAQSRRRAAGAEAAVAAAIRSASCRSSSAKSSRRRSMSVRDKPKLSAEKFRENSRLPQPVAGQAPRAGRGAERAR